ncbi:MAG: phospho-N-acetylmuramoyl-pentapeptide-transferase, partial [Flavobacteriales bacterium]
MLYYLFTYLNETMDLTGAGLFEFISFRASMAIITSLVISLLFGNNLIAILQRKQAGETIRELGLKGESEKKGTPSMGGIIIIVAILLPVLLFAKPHNMYVILMLIATVWLGIIGFVDDYIKIYKKNKEGMAGIFKIIGQISVGLIIGGILYFDQDIVIKEKLNKDEVKDIQYSEKIIEKKGTGHWKEEHSMKTTIPFFKGNEFDYAWILGFLGNGAKWAWIVFIPIVIVIITAVSNGANLTDGLDGLATGTSAIIGGTLGVFAYVSGNYVFSNYLNIMFIPQSGELVIYIAAFVGACVGFLWYNSYPAQVFMGDTGSLTLGGIIAVFAVVIRKELLIPIFCGVFLVENVSVMLQVLWFKYTKSKYGEG